MNATIYVSSGGLTSLAPPRVSGDLCPTDLVGSSHHCTLENDTSLFLPNSPLSFHFALYLCLVLSGVTVNSVDPGVVYTEIMKHFSWSYRFVFWLFTFFCKVGRGGAGSVWTGRGRAVLLCVPSKGETAWPDSSSPLQDIRQGAIPVLYLSLAKELDGVSGKYFSSSCMITLPTKAAHDPQVAQSLWNASVRLTNLDKMD